MRPADSVWSALPAVRPSYPPRRSLFDTGVVGPLVVLSVLAFLVASTLIQFSQGWMDHDGWLGLLLVKILISLALWKGTIGAQWMAAILLWLSPFELGRNIADGNNLATSLFCLSWVLFA